MGIARLHHAQITIPVGAENEARTYYCDLLGLTEIEKPDSLKSRGGFWLEVGDQEVHLGVEPKPVCTFTKDHLAYEVDNLQSFRALLTKRGFFVLTGEPIPGYDRFESHDLFGNPSNSFSLSPDAICPHSRPISCFR